jgi:hypothetical protein
MGLRWALGAAFATATASLSASAQTPCNGAAHTCINAETYWPHAGSSRFFGVGGAELTAQGQASFGIVTGYQHAPLVVHTPSPAPNGGESPIVRHHASANLLFAFGITRRLELFAAFPVTIAQSGEGLRSITAGDTIRPTALGDPRFGFAWASKPVQREVPERRTGGDWGSAVRFSASIPAGERSQFASDRTATFSLSAAAEYRRGRWFSACEIGVRLRATTKFLDSQVGPQALVALGIGVDVLRAERLSALLEARALPSLIGGASSSEWSAGLRSAPFAQRDFSMMLGAGTGIPLGDRGFPNPDFRALLSLRYAPLAW